MEYVSNAPRGYSPESTYSISPIGDYIPKYDKVQITYTENK